VTGTGTAETGHGRCRKNLGEYPDALQVLLNEHEEFDWDRSGTSGTGDRLNAAGESARSAWLMVPGQASGISWRYMRMLAGLPDVKPDRMVIRFLTSALHVVETSIDSDRAADLIQAAAEHFGVDQRALDHEIWEYQSGNRLVTTR
jgi:hypothetical protein